MDCLRKYHARWAYDDPLEFLKPLSDQFILPNLPNVISKSRFGDNMHTLIAGVFIYAGIFHISKLLLFIPHLDRKLIKKKDRIDLSIRTVSLVQACLIVFLGLPVWKNSYLSQDHVFAVTPYSAFYTSMALSYFIWDSFVCIYYLKYFGIGFLIHGLVSTLVFCIAVGYGFIHYYSAAFLLFELSTPFLNIRWIGIKIGLPASVDLINNIILILIFFFVRICCGWLWVYELALDLWAAKESEGFTYFGAGIILACNGVLDILNVYWFSKMITVAFTIISGWLGVKGDDEKLKLM
ncbi:hypothetical protein DAMA08_033870 [Martiniozyma asiatica (nom. inval.)]|nr:hypothetical protein DAMA08_033870 [Martiniozyma asiatica]